LVAFSENARWIEFGEEGLKRTDVGFGKTDLSVFSGTDYRHSPGCDVVGKLEVELRSALLIGGELRLPKERLGKILPNAWGGELLFRCGDAWGKEKEVSETVNF